MINDSEFGGVLPELEDERDYRLGDYSALLDVPKSALPLRLPFDHDSVYTDSQGSSVMCTAFSSTNALEVSYFRHTGIPIRIDALSQWEYQRDIFPRTAMPNGDYLRSAMQALVHRSEAENGIPAVRLDTGAAIRINVIAYLKADVSLLTLKQIAFANYGAVVSGDVLVDANGNSNFANAKKDGYLEFPQGWKRRTGHAICYAAAYESKRVTCVNSYGESWGRYGNGSLHIVEEELAGLSNSIWVPIIEINNAIPNSEILLAIKRMKLIHLMGDHIDAFSRQYALEDIAFKGDIFREQSHATADYLRTLLR